MKLTSLIETLSQAADDLPVTYFTETAEIGAGYHLTELKAATIQSIDCGGQTDAFHEVTMQLLDGETGQPMTAMKLRRILEHSLSKIPALDKADIRVEFAPENKGLQLFTLDAPALSFEGVKLPLRNMAAECKPATRARQTGVASPCQTKAACC